MPYAHWPIGFGLPVGPVLPPTPSPAVVYTIGDLIADILARVGNLKENSGITIFGAANTILNLLYKKLLDRKSDLLASGELELPIPALGWSATLPDDFLSMAEKPNSIDVLTNWMAGTITSYDTLTGILIVNITNSDGTDTLSDWSIAAAPVPGRLAYVAGTSITSLTVGIGAKTLTTQTGLTLTTGQYIIISSATLPPDFYMREHKLAPSYLDDDQEHSDYTWWEWYGIYGETMESPCVRPRRFKIIGRTMFVRPKVIVNVIITGRYNQRPSNFTVPTDVIPWNGFFDEIFREGVVRIIQKGISIPEDDRDFMLFLNGQFDTVINARINLIPNTGRLKRSNWL